MSVMLRIEPEFQEKIPPLTAEEFDQLRENILTDGEVYEPIVTWNGVIVDGHNRWRIIQEHPEIPYRVKEMQFPDKWAAFEWMYKKQLGRRNLTEENRTYCLGKVYEARKKSVGNPGERTEDGQWAQNEPIGRTAEVIAQELGIGRETVKRAEQFAHGVDAIREASPAAADMILRGEANVPKRTVQELAGKGKEEVAKVAKAIEKGEPIRATKFPSGQKHETVEEIELTVSRDRDAPAVEYTPDDFLGEFRALNADYIKKLKRMIETHAQLVSANAAEVETVFTEFREELEKMEGEI